MVKGNVITIISMAAVMTGHALPDTMQGQLTDLITQLFTLLGTASALYSTYHRLTAQPENVTTIIPKKPDQPPTT